MRRSKTWFRRVAPYFLVPFFIGPPLLLNSLEAGDPVQRRRWIAAIWAMEFAVLLVAVALKRKEFLCVNDVQVPPWLERMLLLAAALWLFYAWIPVALGIWDSPRFWPWES